MSLGTHGNAAAEAVVDAAIPSPESEALLEVLPEPVEAAQEVVEPAVVVVEATEEPAVEPAVIVAVDESLDKL